MSTTTSIEWTNKTWNPVRGCSIVSSGCVNCYAMKQAHRFNGPGQPYEGLTKPTKAGPQWTGQIWLVEEALREPLRWKKPARIFVNSMSDLFHEDVPDAFIDRVFAVMALARQHTFQVLTKRPERMREYMRHRDWGEAANRIENRGVYLGGEIVPPLPNVWLGVSVENQRYAYERIPLLLQTPAEVRFVSAEPLIGPVDLMRWMPHSATYRIHAPSPSGKQQSQCVECGRVTAGMERECRTIEMGCGLDWVIVGGESGQGARTFDIEWARSIIRQCKDAGVACFVKQVGSRPDGWWTNEHGPRSNRHGLRDKKGGDPSEWPADLRVREFPAVRASA